jgi:ribonuclease D
MPTPLLTPRYGAVKLIEDESAFASAVDEIIAGAGPIAIDAERASGFRYSQRAYLIQIFRRGGGLHLIDPIPLANSPHIARLWVIHASTQDLPCLREFGISPQRLFDTELAARLAGCERVGLGPLTESLLELSLAKEHSAVDWSHRPLHDDWLTYAALDVDVLLDLRDAVETLLTEQGKLEWAHADFAAILKTPAPQPRQNIWYAYCS